MTTVVEIKEVSKKYGYMWALKPISIKIEDGDSVAILGPNGAGKTTLIKILATHISPTRGKVKICGKEISEDKEKVKKKIGFVAHESFLYEELTIEENLSFYGKLFSVDKDDVVEVIKLLDLEKWYETPIKRLSYGLRKRADIARALIHNPELMLIDELFSGLDESTRNLMVDHFRNKWEKTVLISSHSLEWSKRLCRRGIFLEKGTLTNDVIF
jgi:ABC-type multidrug transport system ATPase subunit